MDEHMMYEEVKRVLDSEVLVTARLVESVTKVAQMSSFTHPELDALFLQWLSLVAGQVQRVAGEGQEISIPSAAQEIGISPSAFLAILLHLQRQGKLSVDSVTIGQGTGRNEDLCDCLGDRT